MITKVIANKLPTKDTIRAKLVLAGIKNLRHDWNNWTCAIIGFSSALTNRFSLNPAISTKTSTITRFYRSEIKHDKQNLPQHLNYFRKAPHSLDVIYPRLKRINTLVSSSTELVSDLQKQHPVPNNDYDQYVEELRINCSKIRDYITRLLNLSETSPARTTIDLDSVFRSAINEVQDNVISANKTTINYNPYIHPISGDFKGYDPVMLKQAIFNILKNAIEHGQAKQIYISTLSGNERLFINIYNDGLPLPKGNIFSARFSTKKQTPDSNHGLGLSFCKDVFLLHEGTISAKNLEKGVQFQIVLPLSGDSLNASRQQGQSCKFVEEYVYK